MCVCGLRDKLRVQIACAAQMAEDADAMSEDMGLRGRCGCCVSMIYQLVATGEAVACDLRINIGIIRLDGPCIPSRNSSIRVIALLLKHSAFGNLKTATFDVISHQRHNPFDRSLLPQVQYQTLVEEQLHSRSPLFRIRLLEQHDSSSTQCRSSISFFSSSSQVRAMIRL